MGILNITLTGLLHIQLGLAKYRKELIFYDYGIPQALPGKLEARYFDVGVSEHPHFSLSCLRKAPGTKFLTQARFRRAQELLGRAGSSQLLGRFIPECTSDTACVPLLPELFPRNPGLWKLNMHGNYCSRRHGRACPILFFIFFPLKSYNLPPSIPQFPNKIKLHCCFHFLKKVLTESPWALTTACAFRFALYHVLWKVDAPASWFLRVG